jgi:hypothetical protein
LVWSFILSFYLFGRLFGLRRHYGTGRPPFRAFYVGNPRVSRKVNTLFVALRYDRALLYLGDQPADNKLLALGLPVDTHRAALTPQLVDDVYQSLVTDPNARRQLLLDNKYIDEEGLWWARTGQIDYVQSLFCQSTTPLPIGTVPKNE